MKKGPYVGRKLKAIKSAWPAFTTANTRALKPILTFVLTFIQVFTRMLARVIGMAALLAPAAMAAQGFADAGRAPHQAEGAFAPILRTERPAPQRGLPPAWLPPKVVLDRMDAARLGLESSGQEIKPGIPLKIGFGRDVPALDDQVKTKSMLAWAAVGDTRMTAISLIASGAVGVRAGLRIEALPDTALLRFYAPGTGDVTEVTEVTGKEIMATLARNLASGDTSEEAKTYWSPIFEGEEITAEIELPAGVSPDAVVVSFPRVSHLFALPLDTRSLLERIGQSASCNLDSMCYQSTWANESLATAKMAFTSAGSSYICTGTLLNDLDTSTTIPYFLSANHCFSTQTVASTLQTYWFYRSSSCNSASLSTSTRTLTGGATLLYASAVTDTSFMRLNSTPPTGVYYAGWSQTLQSLSSAVTGIHNPSGDMQKISFATVTGYNACTSGSGGRFSCTTSSSSSADHLKVVWSQGITEGGSSGSGIWTTSGTSRYLVGQLHGGSSSCAAPTAADYYGRFDLAYNAALYQWLGATSPTPTPVSTARLINLSTRGQVQTGNNVMIGGFIIQGSGSKTVLIRAVGPTLSSYGISNALADPVLQLYSGQSVIDSNDDWGSASNSTAIRNTGLAPSSGLESAILRTLAPGAYTAVVSGLGGRTGVGLVEIYEIDNPAAPFANISTRGQVQAGNDVMIGGFIIQGSAPKTVLIRAIGPNLANYGVSGVLSDPTLQLFSGQTVIATNDDWISAANASAILASGLAPVSSLESAILVTLQPGAYTAIVSGFAGATGVGMIEVYGQ